MCSTVHVNFSHNFHPEPFSIFYITMASKLRPLHIVKVHSKCIEFLNRFLDVSFGDAVMAGKQHLTDRGVNPANTEAESKNEPALATSIFNSLIRDHKTSKYLMRVRIKFIFADILTCVFGR